MKNTISDRVEHFLKDFPPFDLLSKQQLHTISTQVVIKYIEKNQVIFKQGEQTINHFYCIHKGAVALNEDDSNKSFWVDTYDEGDIFGLRPLFAHESYRFTAIAQEECILYAIPIEVFRPIAEKNHKIGSFLMESFASLTDKPYNKEFKFREAPDDLDSTLINTSEDLFEMQPAKVVKSVITTLKEAPIKNVAEIMTRHGIGSIIITNEDQIPLGIATDKDIRTKVATGTVDIHEPISKIMSSPVICYTQGITIAQAQISLMKHKIGHLCITEDGTPNTKIIGIISEHDIIVSRGSNPSVLMKAIKRSNSTKELRRIREKIMVLLKGYIFQNIPMTHISKIIFELNDATVKKIIERSIDKMESPPPVKFAWMSIGSQGRKEQLLHTDQDNALVFENVPEEKLEETRNYFLTLAKKVTKRLNAIGFDYCPAEMMASNPKWCLSLNEWKDQFSHWTTNPGEDEILLCSIFFDYDISYGDVSLTNALADHVFNITNDNTLFLTKLGASALRNASPLGFFRQFLVEKDGEHKDFFDLKKRAIMPITDAGRLLALYHKLKNISNTAERFEKIAELHPEYKEMYLSCSYASKALLKFRTKHGLLNNDNGRYIKLEALTKEEKMKLKRTFKAISHVQEFIKMRFNLSHFM